MKIALIDDMCSCCNDGGAQMNNWGMYQKGIKRGHKITMITPQNMNIRSLEGTELVIFSNIVNFPREKIKEVCEKYPYIFHHKDFIFYSLRLYYPQQPLEKVNYHRDFWLDIFLKAKMHITLSPLHWESFLIAYPELKKFKPVHIPSAIDTNLWNKIKDVKTIPNTVLGINSLEPFKGRYEINSYAEKHPELQFTFIGTAPKLNLPNCNYLGYIPNADLPKIFSQFEYFIHLPDRVDPFNRTVMEAYLCGCKIIGNKNIGCLSYDWDFKDRINVRKYLQQAPIAYWEEIEAIIK